MVYALFAPEIAKLFLGEIISMAFLRLPKPAVGDQGLFLQKHNQIIIFIMIYMMSGNDNKDVVNDEQLVCDGQCC